MHSMMKVNTVSYVVEDFICMWIYGNEEAFLEGFLVFLSLATDNTLLCN